MIVQVLLDSIRGSMTLPVWLLYAELSCSLIYFYEVAI